MRRDVACVLLSAIVVAFSAHADDSEELLGNWKQWSAMQYVDKGQRVCVIWSAPDIHENVSRNIYFPLDNNSTSFH